MRYRDVENRPFASSSRAAPLPARRHSGSTARSTSSSLDCGACVLLAFSSLLPATPACAQSVEFNAHATLLHTGNSLSLSGQTSANGPGATASGHTLISLDSNSVDDVPANAGNPWFAGTTASYLLDGSAAVLHVPAQSNILHAELIWGGSYNYGGENLTADLDQAVTFSTPAGGSAAISPDAAWSHTLNQLAAGGYTVNYYVRAADVTALVALAGEGSYKVSGVPVTQIETINSLNGGGWALVVVAENAQQPCRSVSLQFVGKWIDENSSATVTFADLSTPAAGTIHGRAVAGALAGDASQNGDGLSILQPGPDTYLRLSGPNNPENNFFASQINDGAGLLDTSGTFGTRNHNAAAGTQASGGRQGWDLTAIALDSTSGELFPAQVASALRFDSFQDGYVAVFAGLEVDSSLSCPAPPGDDIFVDGFDGN